MKQNTSTFKLMLVCSIFLYIICVIYYHDFGRYVLYPIFLFTTFFHELGHALMSLVFGGTVYFLDVNLDTSGLTYSSTTNQFITTSGGYLGSMVFGNMMLLSSYYLGKYAQKILLLVCVIMVYVSFAWHADVVSTFLILLMVGALLLVTKYVSPIYVLMFLGMFVILSVLHNNHIGPSGDYEKLQDIALLPPICWVVLYFGISLFISYHSVKRILFSQR